MRTTVNICLLLAFLGQVGGQGLNFGVNFNALGDAFGGAVSFFNENLNPFQNSALSNLVRGALSFGGNSNIIGRAANFVNVVSCSTFKINVGENFILVGQRPKGYCLYCCNIRPAKDIKMYFFDKSNPDAGIPIFLEAKPGALREAGVDNKTATVIFIHGFSETYPGKSGSTIKTAYLRRPEDYNIILVDWTELCFFPWYMESTQNVRIVGQYLAKFLQFYHDLGELPVSKIHMIGFSLGAQVAGYVGKHLRSDLRIPRITGLDPAFPNFPIEDESKRLCKNDAEFVDVIHTDGGIFGFPGPVGHADFFPNGGSALQPGCQPSNLVEMRLIDQIVACSHVRAWELYAESIYNPKAFPSTKCPIWREDVGNVCSLSADAYMGFPARQNATEGQYYLTTRHTRPYARSLAEQIT